MGQVFSLRLCVSAVALTSVLYAEQIDSVEVRGSRWPVPVEIRSGDELDPARLQQEVKRLWNTGRFDDIRVETTERASGAGIVFNLTEKRWFQFRKLVLDPPTHGLQLKLDSGTQLDTIRAQQVATAALKQLKDQGYEDAQVEAELVPVDQQKADLHLRIETGPRYRVREVRFSGDLGAIKPEELKSELKAMRIRRILPGVPGLWNGWRLHPNYTGPAMDADLSHLRSFLFSRGYFDAQVQPEDVKIDHKSAVVNIAVKAGPQYKVHSFAVEGGESDQIPVRADGAFISKDFCRSMMAARRDSERDGVLDFTAQLDVKDAASSGDGKWVDLTAKLERGPAYTVGRIEFRGNHALSDTAVRRMVVLDEGALFDQALLRKSLARLNQSNFFEPLSQSDVNVVTRPGSQSADLVVSLREKKRGRWSFSGPVGPMSVAGPLQFSLASRLPPWGRGILEGSTYFASFSLLGFSQPLARVLPFLPKRGILPLFTLERPFIPGQSWTSGFLIAPQLGWQGMAVSYGATHLQRYVGGKLAGDRAITPDLSVALTRNNAMQPAGAIFCEPPKPSLNWLRTTGGVVINFLPIFSGF